MTEKHTPGPWEISSCADGITIETALEYDDVEKKYIQESRYPYTNQLTIAEMCSATRRKYYPLSEEAKANARLIAAAPDLLAALEAAMRQTPKRYTDERNQYGDRVAKHPDWFDQARAAIAKATGEKT